MLAVLYRKKRDLLNSHILHLTFSVVGTVDSGRESTVIPNKAAFEDLLCDLEVSTQEKNQDMNFHGKITQMNLVLFSFREAVSKIPALN